MSSYRITFCVIQLKPWALAFVGGGLARIPPLSDTVWLRMSNEDKLMGRCYPVRWKEGGLGVGGHPWLSSSPSAVFISSFFTIWILNFLWVSRLLVHGLARYMMSAFTTATSMKALKCKPSATVWYIGKPLKVSNNILMQLRVVQTSVRVLHL